MKTETPPKTKTRLRLLVNSYDQQIDGTLVARHKGDEFEARDEAEVERLTALDVAVDVKVEMEAQQKRLDAETAALEAEMTALKAQRASLRAEHGNMDAQTAAGS